MRSSSLDADSRKPDVCFSLESIEDVWECSDTSPPGRTGRGGREWVQGRLSLGHDEAEGRIEGRIGCVVASSAEPTTVEASLAPLCSAPRARCRSRSQNDRGHVNSELELNAVRGSVVYFAISR